MTSDAAPTWRADAETLADVLISEVHLAGLLARSNDWHADGVAHPARECLVCFGV